MVVLSVRIEDALHRKSFLDQLDRCLDRCRNFSVLVVLTYGNDYIFLDIEILSQDTGVQARMGMYGEKIPLF